MNLPLIIFGAIFVLGTAALIFFIQKSNRAEARKWNNTK